MTYFDSEHCLLSPQQMGQADALTIVAGKSEIELMGNAGREVGRYIVAHYPRTPVTVLCGPGNNGGDGFVVGCYLRARGWPVRLVQFGDVQNYGVAAKHFLDLWGEPERFSTELIEDASLLVDALFGAGLDRPIGGVYLDVVRLANQTKCPIVSVDIPSGLHGGTGQILGDAISAGSTVTFFRKKPGHVLLPGREICGKVELVQIGIQDDVLTKIEPQVAQNHLDLWRLPAHQIGAHKYAKGHCVVVSGPKGATGAARMSALSALRVGAGLVTLNGRPDALAEHGAQLSAIMLRADSLEALLKDERYNAVVLGPGNGVVPATLHNVLTALNANRALLLDADALTIFESDPKSLFDTIKSSSSNVVLTPHAGEFHRLFGDIDLRDGKTAATQEAATRSGAVVVLKGADTVIASPDGRAVINANAPPWLATAGSGDVLAGIIGGLLAQGMEAFDAACAGVYVHGLAACQFGGPGMIATDLPQFVPSALAEARQKLTLS